MLLDDDVMTDGQTKPSSLANGLGREEWTKQLCLYLGRNAGAIVANPDFWRSTAMLNPMQIL
jgi:hypothetical protein